MEPLKLTIEQITEGLFTKIGKLVFEMDIMQRQMKALEDENMKLKQQAKTTK